MIPTKQQWRDYSLLEKWGIISAIATVLGFILAIYVYLFPPITPISISEKIAKDDNHTKLTIEKIEIKKWLGDTEPYITITIRNPSKRTALNVTPSFTGKNRVWTFTPTKTSSLYQKGLTIEAQTTSEFPIAPVSEFLYKIQQDCLGCYLTAIGTTANVPQQPMNSLCEKDLETKGHCDISAYSIPTPVIIKYKTIFDDDIEQFISVFTYLTSKIQTPYFIPSS